MYKRREKSFLMPLKILLLIKCEGRGKLSHFRSECLSSSHFIWFINYLTNAQRYLWVDDKKIKHCAVREVLTCFIMEMDYGNYVSSCNFNQIWDKMSRIMLTDEGRNLRSCSIECISIKTFVKTWYFIPITMSSLTFMQHFIPFEIVKNHELFFAFPSFLTVKVERNMILYLL